MIPRAHNDVKEFTESPYRQVCFEGLILLCTGRYWRSSRDRRFTFTSVKDAFRSCLFTADVRRSLDLHLKVYVFKILHAQHRQNHEIMLLSHSECR
jgi:hypothetical protein